MLTTLSTAAGGRPASEQAGSRTTAERLWPVLTRRPPDDRSVAVLDAALVLLADHGLAASTLAARVAASVRADVYGVVSAGLAAGGGRLHAGATGPARRLLDAAVDDPTAALDRHLRGSRTTPGFGHSVYRRQDPRAEQLLDLLPDGPALSAVDAMVVRLASHDEMFPNIDLALAAMARTYGMRSGAAGFVFQFARIAGWVAHGLEEYREPGVRFRAVGLYTGELPGS